MVLLLVCKITVLEQPAHQNNQGETCKKMELIVVIPEMFFFFPPSTDYCIVLLFLFPQQTRDFQ